MNVCILCRIVGLRSKLRLGAARRRGFQASASHLGFRVFEFGALGFVFTGLGFSI